MTHIYPVILSGGSGSRLWPVSRELYPKQFLPLHSKRPMLVETARRFPEKKGFAPPTIICNQSHRFMVAQCLQEENITPRSIILEPCPRNTAPAITVAALDIVHTDPNGVLLVLPSDHVIMAPEKFLKAVSDGYGIADEGFLLTFGIMPNKPETGYGYIQKGEALSNEAGLYKIQQFVEKPDQETAQSYVEKGDFYWNSGIFLFKAQTFLDELAEHAPDILDAAKTSLEQAHRDMDFTRLKQDAFETSPSISIDCAVMEKTQHGAIFPIDPGWNDIGSWSALWEASEKDQNGNVHNGDTILHNVKNSLVYTDENSLAAVIGIEDLIIVNNDDVLLVASQKHSQDVKVIVEQLKKDNRIEARLHSTVHRPWGTYRTTETGENYLVKTITVSPGASLSLQYHNHRAEHWVVVKGEATVTKDKDTFTLGENQSTFIPVGMTHRLENKTDTLLMMVEVQSGSYIDEDDIVRLKDFYSRDVMTS